MIIKSISRKGKPSFGQLVSYLDRDGHPTLALCHNLFSCEDDRAGITDELAENAGYLATRANGTTLFHEVLSLEGRGKEVSHARQGEILLDIAQHYLSLRAPKQLGYVRVHLDTGHAHCHVILSSNQPRSSRRERLSKQDFARIQKETEDYVLNSYPELNERPLYTRERARDGQKLRIGSGEYHAARREGRAPLKQTLQELLAPELVAATSSQNLSERIAAAGYRLYERGSSWGIENNETGRCHRLTTLGLGSDVAAAKQRFAHAAQRRSDLALEREQINADRDSLEGDERCD